MPSPFPGMDPYLEHPELWPALHHLLISEIFRFLSPQLRPTAVPAVMRYSNNNKQTNFLDVED